MGVSKNHFRNMFKKVNMNYKKGGNGISLNITLDMEGIGKKLDIAQDALDAQVWNDVSKYMPMDTGNLISETGAINATVRGEVYLYPPDSDYGHYQYEGIKYVDPLYEIGAFYNPDYGFWSREGVTKIPSNEPLFYGRDGAEAHWDEAAYQNHHKQWVKVVKNAVK
ncbi:hypothetical protein [Kineothrix sedimenti]|uniref:Minor capsid protein n=1 Tax=Kineothrix sedimenti TaxID=3123317 RepID=A0ABZ3EUX7_9FIRM